MSVQITVAQFEVKATNYIIFKNFYVMLYEYLFTEIDDYGKRPTSEFQETYFFEARSGNSKEIWVWWRPTISLKGQMTKGLLKVDLHTVGLTDVELARGGKRIKAQKGKVEVLVKTIMIIDPQGFWGNSKIFSPFLKLFYKTMYKKIIEARRKELLEFSFRFQEYCKALFNMTSFSIVDPYHPIQGLPPEDEE